MDESQNKTYKRKKNLRANETTKKVICINRECRLRTSGCKGFEGCPGYKAG